MAGKRDFNFQLGDAKVQGRTVWCDLASYFYRMLFPGGLSVSGNVNGK